MADNADQADKTDNADNADKAVNYLSVRIGSQWYGIKVDQVIEVLHLVAYAELPGLRDDVLGFVLVRGEGMPLIDLRRRFGLEDVSFHLDTPIVAIREDAGPVALLVDDADCVEEIPESQIMTSPESRQFPFIRAAVRLPGHLLFLLDTHLVSSPDYRPTNQPTMSEENEMAAVSPESKER